MTEKGRGNHLVLGPEFPGCSSKETKSISQIGLSIRALRIAFYLVLFGISQASALAHSNLSENGNYRVAENETEQPAKRIIRGKVTSADSPDGLPGVTVTIKGSTQGTVTSASGEYALEVEADDAVLIFSFIGFKTQEIAASEKTVIDIVLIENIESLDEV